MTTPRTLASDTATLEKVRREPADRLLLERFVTRRDEGAFQALVERYRGTVWSVCRRVLAREQDVEDAFQAVFLVLARKAGSIHKRDAVGSWLYGVAYRTAQRARRRAIRRQDYEKKAAGARAEKPPWGEAAARELQKMLDEEMQRLAEKFRAPFVLCCLEGMSKSEAAEELGWKQGTVSSRLAQARKLLQKRLARRGVTLSAILAVGALGKNVAAAAPLAPTTLMGQAATPTPAASQLADGVARSMALAKLKVGAASLAGLLSLVAGVGLAALQFGQGSSQPPGPEKAPITGTFLPRPEELVKPLEEQVMAEALSRDGKTLATAGSSQRGRFKLSRLKFWDVAAGKETATLDGIGGTRSLAFSPDGSTLACGEFGGTIRLRDPRTGKEQAPLRGHQIGVNSVAFSEDGHLLASAGLDKIVKLWDWQARKETKQFVGHADMVFSVAFFHHGQALVTAGRDKTAKIWDIASGKEKFTLRGHAGGIEMVAVSPDDKLVATASWDGFIKLWDAATGQETASLNANKGSAIAVAFSPDGKWLAGSVGNGRLVIWDVSRRQIAFGLERHYSLTWGLAFTPDGKTLASCSNDTTAKLWDLEAQRLKSTLWCGDYTPMQALALSHGGVALALATLDKTIQIRDGTSGVLVRRLPGPEAPLTCLAFSPDDKALAGGSADGALTLWDPSGVRDNVRLPGHAGGVTAVAFGPGSSGVLASAGADHQIKLWDVISGQERAVFAGHKGPVRALAFSPDGRHLASGSMDTTIKIWDLATQKEVNDLQGHAKAVRALAYFPTGTLASAGEDASVKLWELPRGAELMTLTGGTQEVRALAVAPGGRTLVSAGEDAGIHVWDVAGGRLRQLLEGPTFGTLALAFEPGGNLISGSPNMKVLRWSAGSAEPPAVTVDVEKQAPAPVQPVPVKQASKVNPVVGAARPIEEASPPPRKSHWKTWLALIIASFFAITLGLGFWLNSRRTTTSSVSVPCTTCHKTLKVKPEFAGKKIKCPQCKQPLLVPLDKGRAQPKWRKGALFGAAGACAAIVACVVLAGLESAERGVLEEQHFVKEMDKVKEQETDIFDASKSLPGMKDQDLKRFRAMTNLHTMILNDAPITDEGIKEINTLTGLFSLSLTNTEVTDVGLAHLKDLRDLEELRLDRLAITDAGLVHLKTFGKLRKLTLWRAPVTSAGLVHLRPLVLLEHLSLDETQVGDDGLKELYGLENLRYLSLWRTKVSDAGVNLLKTNLPLLKVNR